jgi:hypothetical protein
LSASARIETKLTVTSDFAQKTGPRARKASAKKGMLSPKNSAEKLSPVA